MSPIEQIDISECLTFVTGFPSGGTTILKSILNSHPQIAISPEMPFIYDLGDYGFKRDSTFTTEKEIEEFREIIRSRDKFRACQNLEATFDFSAGQTYSIVEVLRGWFTKKNAVIWGNKTPQNTENIFKLNALFPSCKFLVISRDVRETALSCQLKWGRSLLLTSHKWNSRMLTAVEAKKQFGNNRVLIIKYEELVADLNSTTRTICDFLGIDHSEQMLEPHIYGDAAMDGMKNSGKPVNAANTEKWKSKLKSSEIKRIEEIAWEAMEVYRYTPTAAQRAKKLGNISLVMEYISDGLATLSAGNRYSKSNPFIPRLKSLAEQVGSFMKKR